MDYYAEVAKWADGSRDPDLHPWPLLRAHRRLAAGAQIKEKPETCAVSCRSTGDSSVLKTRFHEVTYGR